MKIVHPTITSPIYSLVGTYEIDIDFTNENNEDRFCLRIELFQALDNGKRFRCKMWRNELFRIQSSFPQNSLNMPEHDPSDETLLVGSSLPPDFGPIKEFSANNLDEALNKIIQDLGKALEHITSEKVKRDVVG